MTTLRIRNWDKWQSYRKDRGQPPWIKIHREVMRNPDWVSLTDAQRGQLVAMWLLAADRDGVIPASPELIRKLCYLDSNPDINLFVRKGFIDPPQPDATLTPERRQDDQPEAETDTEEDYEANASLVGRDATRPKSDEFERFKKAYPKRRGANPTAPARKKFLALVKSGVDPNDLIRGAAGYASEQQELRKVGTEFIQRMTTWLNQECWRDYQPTPETPEATAKREDFMRSRGYIWSETAGKYVQETAA